MRNAVLTAMIVAAALTSGCTRIRNNIGYISDEELVRSVQPGVDNKQSVMATLGRPSIAGAWDDRTWYYVSRNTKQLAFAQPKVDTQQIIAVSFDPKGNVSAVKRTGKEQIARIDPVGDKTKTLGRDLSLFDELFGDIGTLPGDQGKGGDSTNPN